MSRRLRRIGAVGAIAVGIAAVVMFTNGLAGAQAALPISVSPGNGPPGTVITVSGDECTPGEPGGEASVALQLLDGADQLAEGAATPDETGSWSGTLTVPPDDALAGATLTIAAQCLGGTAMYTSGSFSVDATPPTTDPPSTTTTTTIPSTPGPGRSGPPSAGAPSAPPAQAGLSVDLMPPATPVAAQPTHTG